MDILGKAIKEFYNGESETIEIIINGKRDDPMSPGVFFRRPDELTEIEIKALNSCLGKTLDIGAGAGSHTLALQNSGIQVDAIEISELSCQVMSERGVKSIFNDDIFKLKNRKYDTILLLMNGLGIIGTIEQTFALFNHLKTLLNPNGKILGDSTDITYLSKDKITSATTSYYGEVTFELLYKNQLSKPFPWVYIDKKKMEEIANLTGFSFRILTEDNQFQYLAEFKLQP